MPHRVRSLALVALAVVVTLAGLRLAAGGVGPLVLGGVAALALDPVVQVLQRVVRSRAAASAIAVIGLIVILAGSAYSLSDEFASAAKQMPEATERLRTALRDWRRSGQGPFDALGRAADN